MLLIKLASAGIGHNVLENDIDLELLVDDYIDFSQCVKLFMDIVMADVVKVFIDNKLPSEIEISQIHINTLLKK